MTESPTSACRAKWLAPYFAALRLGATEISTFLFPPIEVQKDWTLSVVTLVIRPLSWAQGTV
jgi:hypothetical protein